MENFLISHPKECETIVGSMAIQADESTESTAAEEAESVMWTHVWKRIQEFCKYNADSDWLKPDTQSAKIHLLLENMFFSYHFFKCTDNYITWAQLTYRLFTNEASTVAVMRLWTKLFEEEGPEVQGGIGDGLRVVRGIFDTVTDLESNPILRKFHKLYTHMLVQGFLKQVGLHLNEDEYSRLEIHALKASSSGKRGLWMAAFDVLLFLAEKTYEFHETHDISVFLHTSSEYSDWLKESDRLVSLANFTGNLGAHGTSYFSFVADINNAIEKGDAYVKYSKLKSGYESIFLQKRLGQLKLIKATTLTKDAAQRSRKSPFGVLIHGKSGVAKSSVMNMLFYYYAKLRGLSNSESAKFTRNSLIEHWTNFDSDKWCIVLDDVAFMNPNKCPDIDPTLKDMILIMNNVAYAPAQAALEDKGKTPVLSELVLASTNTIDMNAFEYFSDPLAVQRRLPYVVTVEVREEFCLPGSHMLDSSKAVTKPGEFPDFWRFIVSTVEPIMEGKKERGKIVERVVYERSTDFLKDFAEQVMKHRVNQDTCMACNDVMKGIEICPMCLAPRYVCKCPMLQAAETVITQQPVWTQSPQTSLFWSWTTGWFVYFYMFYVRFYVWMFKFSFCMKLVRLVLYYRCLRSTVYSLLLWSVPGSYQVQLLGLLNSISNVPAEWRKLSSNMKLVIAVATSVVGTYAVTKFTTKGNDKPLENSITKMRAGENWSFEKTVVVGDPQKVEPVRLAMDSQGNKFNTTEEQMVVEQRQNVWYNPTVETTPMDLPVASQSLVNVPLDTVKSIFGNNVVALRVSYVRGTDRVVRTLGGVYLTSQCLLTQPHLFADDVDDFSVTIIQGSVVDGVTPNVSFKLKRSEIVFRKDMELCMFKTIHNQPKRDIRKFWLEKQDLTVTRMLVIQRGLDGLLVTKRIVNAVRMDEVPIPQLGVTIPVHMGLQDVASKNGDCGSLAIADIPRGLVLCGMHILGRERQVGEMIITLDVLEGMIEELDSNDFMPLKVQCGDSPVLTCSKHQYNLGPVDVRSKVRYLDQGTVRVYGTLIGARARPKSNVCATPLQEEMCEHFGVGIEHCAPALKGYEPWRRNLNEMVKPFCDIDREKIDRCVRSYFNDILAELPKGWEAEMHFLSKKAAVNGLPGVQYVDGINRSSSMGFPFSTSKKHYLTEDTSEVYPDGVTFCQEVWDQYDEIIKCYKEGRRANPIFNANLKDEPVPIQKFLIKKTRVFTGSPVAWSLVTRSRLLTFVRLVQKNKFAFEAAPGVVTMSSEWGRLRDYLTAFGDDRLFAGDYGHYDKGMIAYLILCAFMMIARFYQEAGFSGEECQEILCIGYDVAFSWCNFDGDLLQFFGTNPSGHPLTVIINSLVNSIYMRVAYLLTNPKEEVETFKQNVHLMTYGDDNAGGVREGVDWFNHTSISAALATLGLEYTMADKKSVSVPYIHIDEVSFLKRKWRWDADMEQFLCPLEKASITKALTVWVASGTIDPIQQMAAVIVAMHDEFFFYGKEEFETQHKFFLEVLSRYPYCEECTVHLSSWEELAVRYRRCSTVIDAEYCEHDMRQQRFGCLIAVNTN
jgi:hypothetical protein